MKRAGPMLALSLVIAMVVVACASMRGDGRDHVARAVQAQGGTDAMAKVKTISQKGTVRQWAPEQSQVAGGEMRFANQATMESITDVTRGATRTDWVRDFQYPAQRTFTFSEVVTAEAGYVAGIDSSSRTKQSQESIPPAHTMSGLRLAASQRELARSSPLLALEMAQNPDRVSAAPDVTVSGVTYKAAAYRVGAQTLTVMFDPATGLPARVRSLGVTGLDLRGRGVANKRGVVGGRRRENRQGRGTRSRRRARVLRNEAAIAARIAGNDRPK